MQENEKWIFRRKKITFENEEETMASNSGLRETKPEMWATM